MLSPLTGFCMRELFAILHEWQKRDKDWLISMVRQSAKKNVFITNFIASSQRFVIKGIPDKAWIPLILQDKGKTSKNSFFKTELNIFTLPEVYNDWNFNDPNYSQILGRKIGTVWRLCILARRLIRYSSVNLTSLLKCLQAKTYNFNQESCRFSYFKQYPKKLAIPAIAI